MTQAESLERYRHTQIGYLMLVSALTMMSVGVLGLILMPLVVGITVSVISFPGAALLVLLFGWLTVVVRGDEVEIRFGIGLVRKRIDLNEFVDVQVVRNRWYHGWGIRMGPQGVLYNVSGLDAVELTRSGGKAVRIGTDEPHALKWALHEALNAVH